MEEDEAQFDGSEGFATGFNPQYLLDGITAAGAQGADTITLAFTTPGKPVVISGGSAFRYLLAPMRR